MMRNMKKALGILAFLATALLPFHLEADDSSASVEPVATLIAAPAVLNWSPLTDYERLVLTVAGPENLFLRLEFDAGNAPSLSLTDPEGNHLPNGDYTWELRVVPRVDAALRERMMRAREAGDESALENLKAATKLPKRPLVQSGSLSIRNGVFVAAEPSDDDTAVHPRPESRLRNVAANDLVEDGDLIVIGNACIGGSCSNSDADLPTLKLKNPFVNILFETVESPPSLTSTSSRDWALRANPAGADQFSLQDVDDDTTPVSVAGGAPDDSLYVRGNGNLGLGTSTPAQDVHAISGNTPAIRLEQDGSESLATRTWDMGANEANFFVRDVTNSSSRPFKIQAGAPSDTLVAGSNVGMGTASPSSSLHVKRNDGTAQLLVEEASSTAAQRTLFRLKNNGGVQLFMRDDSANGGAGVEWALQNVNAQARITDVGDATNELVLDQSGNLTVAGTITAASSRMIKERFSPVDSRDILRRVLDLPVATWSYKATPGVRHVGPVSEDFFAAFAVGSDDKGISVTDSAGVALAAIQGLYLELAARDAEIAALRARLEELSARLEQQVTP